MISSRQRLTQLIAQRQDLTLGDAVRFINDLWPVIDLGHLDPEEWFIAGILAWWHVHTQAAVALENAQVQLWNDTTLERPSIVVLTGFNVRAINAAQVCAIGPSNTEFGSAQLVGFRDTQWNPTGATGDVPGVQMGILSQVGLGNFSTRFMIGAPLSPAHSSQLLEAVLAPQTGIVWGGETVNDGLNVATFGYKLDLRVR